MIFKYIYQDKRMKYETILMPVLELFYYGLAFAGVYLIFVEGFTSLWWAYILTSLLIGILRGALKEHVSQNITCPTKN